MYTISLYIIVYNIYNDIQYISLYVIVYHCSIVYNILAMVLQEYLQNDIAIFFFS